MKLSKFQSKIIWQSSTAIVSLLTLILAGSFIFVSSVNSQINSKTTEADIEKIIEQTRPIDVIRMSAEDLFADYDSNELSASRRYAFKVLVIRGTLRAVRQEKGKIYAEVEGDKYGFTAILCVFPTGKGNELTLYSKGEQIALKGMVLGKGLLGIGLFGRKIVMWPG